MILWDIFSIGGKGDSIDVARCLWHSYCLIQYPWSRRASRIFDREMSSTMEIANPFVTPAQKKPRPSDDSALGFGQIFSDHMFRMEYSQDKGWHGASIVPYGPIALDPASMVLHYGQEIFEGLKAYRGHGGAVWLFRPRECRQGLHPRVPRHVALCPSRDDRHGGGLGRTAFGGVPVLHHHRPRRGLLRPGVRAGAPAGSGRRGRQDEHLLRNRRRTRNPPALRINAAQLNARLWPAVRSRLGVE